VAGVWVVLSLSMQITVARRTWSLWQSWHWGLWEIYLRN